MPIILSHPFRKAILLTILFLLPDVLSQDHQTFLPRQMLGLFKSSSPQKSLSLNSPEFAIYVDFVDLHDGFYSNKTNILGGNMAIALYSNETIIGGDCNSFLPYNCRNYECHPVYEDKRSLSNPYFDVTGYTVHTPLYMDYTHFFNSETHALYAQNCSENYLFKDRNLYGVIGMGTDGEGLHNYMLNLPVFSIYMNNDSTNAELSFDCNPAKGLQDGSRIKLDTTGNWEVNIHSFKFAGLGDQNDVNFFNLSMAIFDINVPYIGLPSKIFDSVLILLSKTFGVHCDTKSNSLPLACTYSGKLEKLPSFHMNNIEFNPNLYLKELANNTYHLNVISLSHEDINEPHQKVGKKYANHIILGRSFFHEFYVCFSHEEELNQITIYKRVPYFEEESHWSTLAYVTLGVVISIPIVFFMIFCVRGVMAKKESEKENPEKRQFKRSRTEHISIKSPLLSSPRGLNSPRGLASPRSVPSPVMIRKVERPSVESIEEVYTFNKVFWISCLYFCNYQLM